MNRLRLLWRAKTYDLFHGIQGDRMTWRLALTLAAVLLFIIGGAGALDWLDLADDVNVPAMLCFGGAAFAGAHI